MSEIIYLKKCIETFRIRYKQIVNLSILIMSILFNNKRLTDKENPLVFRIPKQRTQQ